MKVSVVLTTARWGGFDVLLHSMLEQTMSRADFEVIVVDELHEKRCGLLESYNPGFRIKHIPPYKKVPVYDNSTGFNSGLLAAEGKLVCFLIDYMWVPPSYLQTHWDFYKDHPGWSLTGYVDRYPLPELYPHIKTGLDFNLEAKIAYSTFRTPWTSKIASNYFTTHEPVYRERKGGVGAPSENGLIEIPWDKIYLIPDSIPLSVLHALNGLDERFNGYYGSNDIDLAMRASRLGWRFALGTDCLVQKLGDPTISVALPAVSKPKLGTSQEAYRMFLAKVARIDNGKEPLRTPEGCGPWT